MNRTEELLDNITIQQEIIFNATGVVSMANSTTLETLAIRVPSIDLAQMLARKINNTFLPAAEVATIAMAVANSTVVTQQTLQITQNARYIFAASLPMTSFFLNYSELVDQISTLVNDTLDKITASELLHDQVNITLQQLLQQQRDIENYASQVSKFISKILLYQLNIFLGN